MNDVLYWQFDVNYDIVYITGATVQPTIIAYT